MKSLITTLNAKFIHTAIAIRLLYVASYHDHDIDMKEYTIKDQLENIRDDILAHGYDIVGFSCYIWNVDYLKKLCHLLKEAKPEIILILGGPEVTYEVEHFVEHFEVDYVMAGEGEETWPQLLTCLEEGKEVFVKGVSYKGHIDKEVACVDLKLVESLDSPYNLPQDQDDMDKRILYFETSRGCPFQCQYCLSSLEKGLRFFSEEYLKKQLDIITHSKAKTIKLLDRSFNAKVKHSIMILDYIFKNYTPGQQYQFEINADVMQQPILDFIKENAPEGLLRFEVGIQSTYEPTNRAVKRMQNFERLSEVVKELMDDGKCDLHLDLIAGLPYESYNRFKQSFNEVFAFRAKELQLGFLKLLRGTSLREEADKYGYIYQEESPYEMTDNHWISENDIHHVHIAEDMLEKYWNSGRFPRTMNYIMDHQDSPFDFLHDLGIYYQEHGYKHIGYQLYELFDCLDHYMNSSKIHDLLLQDFYPLFKTKPKRWFKSGIENKNEIIHYLVENENLDQNLLFRYSIIEKLSDGRYMVIIYKDMHCLINYYEVKQ